MKLVHAADLHLDSALRGLSRYESAPVDDIRGATRRALANLVELCIEERAALLLLAGDLFDGDWRDVSTGLHFAAQMAKLVEAGTRVVWIRGNHDAASQIRRNLRLPERVVELGHEAPETRHFDELGVAVHGQSFARRDVTEDLAALYPIPTPGMVNIGLLHTALEGRPGHDRYAPCKAERLAAHGYDYWALGHVHQREVLHTRPYLVFPGNLQGRHAREGGEKGATVITIEGEEITGVEHRALDVVRWAEVRVDASALARVDDVLAAARTGLVAAAESAQGRLLAARIVVHGETELDSALRAAKDRALEELCSLSFDIGGAGVWLEKLLVSTAAPKQAEVRGDEALAEIERALASLAAGADHELLELFADFTRKLPHELHEAVPELFLRDPQSRAELFADVRSLLYERLTPGAGPK